MKLFLADRLIAWQKYRPARQLLERHLMRRVDGCVRNQRPDRDDWIEDCQAQEQIYWAINEILVLMDMLD